MELTTKKLEKICRDLLNTQGILLALEEIHRDINEKAFEGDRQFARQRELIGAMTLLSEAALKTVGNTVFNAACTLEDTLHEKLHAMKGC